MKHTHPNSSTSSTPQSVVEQFLRALEQKDHDTIAALLAPDLLYTNVSLPSLRGGQRVAKLFKLLLNEQMGFAVQTHQIAVDGDMVLTERTDLITAGPLHMAFWVCGTFQVRDGQIVLWRDYFDWLAVARGAARGLAGVLVPQLRVKLPHSATRP